MRVEVDRHTCISSGPCPLMAPEVFDHDDDGFTELPTDRPDPEQYDDVRESVVECPTGTIRLGEE